MYTVFGAGSVGTVLAALFADAGVDVAIAGRAAVAKLRVEGDDETVDANVPVLDEPSGTILLCVHEPDVEELATRWLGRTVVSFANGVRTFDHFGHAIWRMTCTLVRPGFARFTRRGRVIVESEALAADLSRAGFDAAVSTDITADRWLKLFVNLTSAPNALVRKQDHTHAAFGALKAALLEEALALFRAVGIDARSCDGRDRSPEEEIAAQRLAGGRERPVHNSVWRTLARGLPVRERFHDAIAALGPAPRNLAMQRLLDSAREPECYSAEEALSAVSGT